MADETKNKVNKTNLIVITPYDEFFEGFVESVILPSQDGVVGIMAGHMPLVLAIFPGIATFKNNGETKSFVLSEGYAEISQHMVMIVCNSAEWPEQIDVKRTFKALNEKALKIKDSHKGDYKIKDWQDGYNRAKARIHLVETCGSESQKETLARLRGEKD